MWISHFLQLVHCWHDHELARNWRLVRPFISRHPRFELEFGWKLVYCTGDPSHLMGEKVSHVVGHRGRVSMEPLTKLTRDFTEFET